MFSKHKILFKEAIIELLILLLIFLAITIEIGHIVTSNWLNLFFVNGDSLTLALLRKSMLAHEAFHYVSSAQLNLFPEGMLYYVISLFFNSYKSIILVNAYINVFFLYLIIRLFLSRLTTSVVKMRLFSFFIIAVFVLSMLLLQTPSLILASNSNIPTYPSSIFYLLSTYYYGIIICGLLNLYIVMSIFKNDSHSIINKKFYLCVLFFLNVLTTISNPLYVLEFIIPILAILLIFRINKIIKKNLFNTLFVLESISVIIGLISRIFFHNMFDASLKSHFTYPWNLGNYSDSLLNLINIFGLLNKNFSYRLYLAVIFFSYITFIFYYLIKLKNKFSQFLSIDKLLYNFLALFIIILPIFIIILLSITGSIQTRYLTVIFITPFLIPIYFININIVRIKKYFIYTSSVIICLILYFGFISIHKVNRSLNFRVDQSACIDSLFDGKNTYGLGDYWIVRGLDLYDTNNVHLLASYNLYIPYIHLNNFSSYYHHNFTFFIFRNSQDDFTNNVYIHEKLGNPSKVDTCGEYKIIQYYEGTRGNMIINNAISNRINYYYKFHGSIIN